MKKLISIALVLVLALALSVPAFAATTKDYTQAELYALVSSKVPAAYQAQANEIVKTLPLGLDDVNVDLIKEAQADVAAIQGGTYGDTTKLQAAVQAVADKVATATNNVVVANDLKVTLNGLNGDVSITATVAGTAVAGGSKVDVPAWTDSSKKTESNTAAAAAGVIKATGFDSTTVVLVVLSIAGLLGVATVKARKMD